MSETVVSSVLSVTGTPARWRRASGCVGQRRHDPGLPVRGRAQVERHATRRSARRTSSGSSIATGPWAIRSGSTASARRTWCGAAPLAGMDGDAQAARPGGLERRGVGQRIRERAPRARRGPAGQPLSRKRAAVSASATLASGSCERSAVAMRRTSIPSRAVRRIRAPRHDRRDPVRAASSPPATWSSGPQRISDVADVVGAPSSSTSSRGDPLERLGVLHQRDRQVEGAQQLGLVGDWHRAPTSAARIPAKSRGASMPRVRARSSAVSIRSEPSRWRWSSALGIASTSAPQRVDRSGPRS